MESREDLIKNHYMARIAELTSQLQLADSKSVHFYAEVSGVDKIATSPYPFQPDHGSGSVLRLLGEITTNALSVLLCLGQSWIMVTSSYTTSAPSIQ